MSVKKPNVSPSSSPPEDNKKNKSSTSDLEDTPPSTSIEQTSSSSSVMMTSSSVELSSSTSSSGPASDSLSLPLTEPVGSSQEDILSQEEYLPIKWGLLYSLQEGYPSITLTSEIGIYTFGRDIKGTYIFLINKIKNFASSLSVNHFSVYRERDETSRTGFKICIKDTSSCGTFLNGVRLEKNVPKQIVSSDRISLAVSANKVFLFFDLIMEEKDHPVGFEIKYGMDPNVVLGEGAYGVVKKGFIRRTNEPVAVKIVKKSSKIVSDTGYEGALLCSLEHPNIVQVKDMFENEKVVYLVMEFLCGGDLLEHISKVGVIPEIICKKLFKQLLEAIKYLHNKKVLHRDIKPENIMLTSKDINTADVKITDFGLSRLLGDGSVANTLVGTFNYCAPEVMFPQKHGVGYNFSADRWSLGCVLFVMLSGQPPFHNEGKEPIHVNIQKGYFEFQEIVWKDISDGAKDLVKQFINLNGCSRISLDEAMKHCWFTGAISQPKKKIKLASNF